MKLAFIGTKDTQVETILTQGDGSAILFPPPPVRRRRAVGAGGGRTILLDGNNDDWKGLPMLVSGEATNGGPALRMIGGVYAYATESEIFFYFSIQSNQNAATANNGGYTVLRGKSFFVGPPGVLNNDFDPSHNPLTAILISGVQHATTNNGVDLLTNSGAAISISGGLSVATTTGSGFTPAAAVRSTSAAPRTSRPEPRPAG
jgi:hypothetical protein